MTRYAVIGDPVEHSKSPQIHSQFAAQTGEDVEYSAIRVTVEELPVFVNDFFAAGGGGLNVTVPLKEAAFRLSKLCSPRAALAKAVNTFYLDQEGNMTGDNTDGTGLLRDLLINNKYAIAGKSLLILGAGGAVRGILGSLIEQGPGAITLLNRTLSRAQQLKTEFAGIKFLEVADYESFQGGQFDLIINGTSMSLEGQAPPLDGEVIASGGCCYDLMYGSEDTAFVSWAKTNGAALALDGIGMLVEQAAESFTLWRGIRPDTRPVIAQLKAR